MRPWLLLISLATALKLRESKVTPLQLAIKYQSSFCNTIRIIYTTADLAKCLDDLLHLTQTRSFGFYDLFKENFPKMLLFHLVTGPFHAAGRHLAHRIGLEGLSEIPRLGERLAFLDIGELPLLGPTLTKNLSTSQLKRLIDQVIDPESPFDVLTGAWLRFGADIPSISSILHDAAHDLVDPFFLNGSPRLVASLTPELAIIGIGKGMKLQVGVVPDLKMQSAISAHFSNPWSQIDLIRRLVQVGSLVIYSNSFSSRRCKSCTAVTWQFSQHAAEAFHRLSTLILRNQNALRPWDMEVRIIAQAVRSYIYLDVEAKALNALLEEGGWSRPLDIYKMFCEFAEQVIVDGGATLTQISMVTRIKIELLVLLAQFDPDADIAHGHVVELLGNRRYAGHLQNPRCRHLFFLLWALNQASEDYSATSRLITRHILAHIPKGTDLTPFHSAKIAGYLPAPIFQKMKRQNFLSSTFEVEETVRKLGQADSLRCKILFESSIEFSDLRADITSLVDIDYLRNVVLRLILTLIDKEFIYCGHDANLRPVYIQSLACHPFRHLFFTHLLHQADLLRIRLPFTLHPLMIEALDRRASVRVLKQYVIQAFRYEIWRTERPPRLLAISALTEHLNAGKDSNQDVATYSDLIEYKTYLIRRGAEIGFVPIESACPRWLLRLHGCRLVSQSLFGHDIIDYFH